MAKDKTTLRFWLRTDRPNQDGSSPVHIVYQIKGQRKYFGIPNVKLYPVNWSMDLQRAVYVDKKQAKKIAPDFDHSLLMSASEVTEVNSKLQDYISTISDIETRFKLDKVVIYPKLVIDALKTAKRPEVKREDPGVNLIDFIRQFVNDSRGTHKAGTLKVYTGLAAHLEEYQKASRQKLTFDLIDIPQLRRINSYLTEDRGMNNVTAAKQMSTLKTLLNYARTLYNIPVRPDYRDYKVSRKDSDFEVITLTQDEFLSVYNLDLSGNSRLDKARDVFCFACATGLRYSDLSQLRREHIRKDNTIRMTAAKTGQKLVIPLNPVSYSILQKYKGQLRPLPIISNQKTNDYIKEIGKLAGIDTPIEKVRVYGVKKVAETFPKYELLSIHVGRKSFITLSLEKGIQIQEVMALSGHTTYKAFRRYVDVNDNRKKTVMAEAWGAVNPLKKAN